MIRFQCDYAEGAHPLILKKMEETNYDQTVGYGNDPYCESAREKIKKLAKRRKQTYIFSWAVHRQTLQ